MKALDYRVREWRYRAAERHVPEGASVLDLGGFDGSFLRRLCPRISRGVCLDPLIEPGREGALSFMRGDAREGLPFEDGSFDAVVMLAVYEHLGSRREAVTAEVARVLREGGRAILTVPSPLVDDILPLLMRLGLLDGMSPEEHERFPVSQTAAIFERRGFELVLRSRFQLGLNNLFVFARKSGRKEGRP